MGKTVHVVRGAGLVTSAYGLLKAPVGGGNPIASAQQGNWSDVKYQLTTRVAFWSPTYSQFQGARAAQAEFYGGLALAGPGRRIVGWALRQLGIPRGFGHHPRIAFN